MAHEMKSILMIDDDSAFSALVNDYFLNEGGFRFSVASDGKQGETLALAEAFDVIIIDVTMPEQDGFETLRAIRKHKDTPIIMFTARGDDFDKILGLELGADDYVPKPCHLRELVARVKAIIRRVNKPVSQTEQSLQYFQDLEINSGAQSVKKAGSYVALTSAEFLVLEKLLERKGEVVSKDDISRYALGRRITAFDRSVDAHVGHLRKKLGPAQNGMQRIKTVRGKGYLYVIS